MTSVWTLYGLLVATQLVYPLLGGGAQDAASLTTVALGALAALVHAFVVGGRRCAVMLLAVGAAAFGVEAVGVATGVPFGQYEYSDALGPAPLGVSLAVPLAWMTIVYPAWLAAGVLAPRWWPLVAGYATAAWDLFLDPQMVAAGRWSWADPSPHLPGVPDVPLSNYAGWLVVATALVCLLGRPSTRERADAAPLAFYLWLYVGGLVAHIFLLPDVGASALWGGVGMGLVAVPLGVVLASRKRSEVEQPA